MLCLLWGAVPSKKENPLSPERAFFMRIDRRGRVY